MRALKIFGLITTSVAILLALLVMWRSRHKSDDAGRRTRYNMLGTISLCAIVPARVFLEQRLGIVLWFGLLVALVGGGAFFLRKAR